MTWGFSILFCILWLACAVHCWRNEKIYRLVGLSTGMVKILWFLLFFTFSPFALLAYAILGIWVKPRDHRSIVAHVLYVLMFAIVVVIAVPRFLFESTEPIRLVRGPDQWQEVQTRPVGDGLDIDRILPKFHAGFIVSRSGLQTTSAITSGSNAILSASHVAILLESDHPFLADAAVALVERLKQYPAIERIDLIPLGGTIERGKRLADAWIHLEVISHSEIQISPVLRIQSEIAMKMESEPYTSMHGYQETYSLPHIQYNLTSELSHCSTTTAIGSGRAKYDLAAQDVGKELFGAIEQFLDTQRAKYGEEPLELESFIVPRDDLGELPLKIMRDVEPKVEGYLPLATNRAYWVIPLQQDIRQEFDDLTQEMESQGWSVQSREGESDYPYLRFAHENDRVIIYPPRKRPGDFGSEITTYIIHYEQRMEPEAIQSRLKQWIQDGCSVDFLMMMRDWIWTNRDMQHDYLEALERIRDFRSDLLFQKATLYGSMQEFGKQWRTLHEALASEQLIGSESNNQSTIDGEIKKFKEKHPDWVVEISLPEIFESMGVQKLDLHTETLLEREMGLYEPLGGYYSNDQGELQTVSICMLKSSEKNNPAPYVLRVRCWGKRGGSTATVGGNPLSDQSGKFAWSQTQSVDRLSCLACSTQLDDDTFKLTLTVRPD